MGFGNGLCTRPSLCVTQDGPAVIVPLAQASARASVRSSGRALEVRGRLFGRYTPYCFLSRRVLGIKWSDERGEEEAELQLLKAAQSFSMLHSSCSQSIPRRLTSALQRAIVIPIVRPALHAITQRIDLAFAGAEKE